MLKKLSKFKIFILVAGYWLLAVGVAKADWRTTMLRVLCMPEEGLEHFSVGTQTFWEMHKYIGHIATKGKENLLEKRLDVLKKHGLLPAQNFSYSCNLSNFNFKIYGNQSFSKERQRFGPIRISLETNQELVLNNVIIKPMEDGRFQKLTNPFVTKFIHENRVSNPDKLQIMLSNGINEYPLFTERKISQSTLNCLQKNGFFNKLAKDRDAAEKICFTLDDSLNKGD